ncbi:MAG TPA: NAD-dependent epimerase/dehydratase family protein [Actinospica sp.]|jgi:dihydroflavonol-4-reductase|nr:NAD-dependent epimerase/dehydratase family protein [Actinospica sp.]
MSINDPLLSAAPVLVTGGTGFLGTHTVVRLLTEGHRVRTTVRSLDRAAEVRAAVELAGVPTSVADERLEIVAADLAADAGWPEAVDGCTYVLHVASPFYTVDLEHADELIGPARDGSLRVLRAARDAGVQRVVLTSSFAAVGYSPKPGGRYDETDWTNPADTESAYVRSKVIAEAAAWDFVRGEGGGLELTVINPTGIFGPVLSPRLSSSVALVKAMIEGAHPPVPRVYFGVVDVRDAAALHVRAMTEPRAAGERFLASSGEAVSFRQASEILADRLGPRVQGLPVEELSDDQVREAARTVPALRDAAARLGQIPVVDTAKARDLLGWKPRDPADTLVDTAESLLALADGRSAAAAEA